MQTRLKKGVRRKSWQGISRRPAPKTLFHAICFLWLYFSSIFLCLSAFCKCIHEILISSFSLHQVQKGKKTPLLEEKLRSSSWLNNYGLLYDSYFSLKSNTSQVIELIRTYFFSKFSDIIMLIIANMTHVLDRKYWLWWYG